MSRRVKLISILAALVVIGYVAAATLLPRDPPERPGNVPIVVVTSTIPRGTSGTITTEP